MIETLHMITAISVGIIIVGVGKIIATWIAYR
jgi:hypothetical protein